MNLKERIQKYNNYYAYGGNLIQDQDIVGVILMLKYYNQLYQNI